MRFRKTLSFLILATALVFARGAWAHQKPVAPGLSPAHADVAASLPRHGGVKPPLRYAALKGGATTATSAKPFTQDQVSNMVRDGFGDDSGAKLIEQRGIDFALSEDFYQTLKAAGASEAFLNALRAAKPPELASARKPLNQVQVFALLVGQVPSRRVTMLVQERGIDFERATVSAFMTGLLSCAIPQPQPNVINLDGARRAPRTERRLALPMCHQSDPIFLRVWPRKMGSPGGYHDINCLASELPVTIWG